MDIEELYFKLKDTFKDISEDDLDELVNVIWEKIRRANENHN